MPLLPASGYATEIPFGELYLLLALDYLHSLYPWEIIQDIARFFFFLVWIFLVKEALSRTALTGSSNNNNNNNNNNNTQLEYTAGT